MRPVWHLTRFRNTHNACVFNRAGYNWLIKFLGPCTDLHLSPHFLLWNNVKTLYFCTESEIKIHVVQYTLYTSTSAETCTSSQMIRFVVPLTSVLFYWLYILFVCLAFYSFIFQSQIVGILTPDWRAFEVSQMSHSVPLQHLALTLINPQLHTRAPGSYHWPLNPWRPQGAAL